VKDLLISDSHSRKLILSFLSEINLYIKIRPTSGYPLFVLTLSLDVGYSYNENVYQNVYQGCYKPVIHNI